MRAGYGRTVGLALLALGTAAEAQVPPPGLVPGRPRPELPDFADPAAPPFTLPPIPAPERPRTASGGSFLLRQLRFEGNTAVGEAALAALAAPWLGRVVDAAALEELRQTLTRHYIALGYVNSGAVIPDQEVGDGSLLIRLVEGRLTDVTVSGSGDLDPAYVAERIRLDAGPPLNIERLRDRIRILLQDPLIERINAELQPGPRPGEARLAAAVTRAQPYELRVGVDNAHAPSVGELTGRAATVLRNLSGIGDAVAFDAEFSAGAQQLEGNYSLPVSVRDTRLVAGFQLWDATVVEDPLAELDIDSRGWGLSLGATQPLWRSPASELSLTAALAWRHSETFLLGAPFSFAVGTEDGRSSVTALRLRADWLQRSPSRVVAARSTLSLGLPWFGATRHDDGSPDSRFRAWLGQAQWAERLANGIGIVAAADVQLADDALLPLERFGLGGADSVRGYRENLLVRDMGLAASLELRLPLAALSWPGAEAGSGTLYLTPFVDGGAAWNKGGATPAPYSLLSFGAGLRWEAARDLVLSLAWAHRLRAVEDGEALQDIGLHFSLAARLL